MGSRTSIMFMSVNPTDISLPISDWTKDNDNIWKLFENARDRKSSIKLYDLSGRYGYHFYDILKVIERCNLEFLNFLDIDMIEDESGTTLQGIKLIPVIRSLTIVIDELLKAIDPLWCLSSEYKNSKENMREAFENSEIYHDVNLDDYSRDSYYQEGLFVILKSLLLVMTDALVNNKVFVYIKWTA